MSHDGLIDELRAALGSRGVVELADADRYLDDARGVYRAEPIVVVRPATTDEVALVVARCASAGVGIVPQGGNTGLSGGTTPDAATPSVLLNLGRMNAIEEVNPARWTMTVQAGAIIEAMQTAATEHGRVFAPDWGARGTATIGGAIATDAGGNNVVRYGNMREHILGVEVVLPDGRIWNGIRSLRKDSSGYDLKQLFIGSEGTLGIVTRAVVALQPVTPHVQSALAAVPSLGTLGRLLELARSLAPDELTAFELMPDSALGRVSAHLGVDRPLATRTDFYVLMKLAGAAPVTDTIAAILEAAAADDLVVDAVVAGTADQEERLWTMRDEMAPQFIYRDTQHAGIKLDTAVPIDRVVEFIDGVSAIVDDVAPDAFTYAFGHLGDGNLHVMVLPGSPATIEPFLTVRADIEDRIDQLTFDLDGTLSAEHGIGRLLRDRIDGQKDPVEWELMAGIKNLLDPNGIMNPGALLPRPRG